MLPTSYLLGQHSLTPQAHLALGLPEVLHLVTECIYYTAHDLPDYRVLSKMTLVCRTWLEIVQPMLFKRVRLLDAHSTHSFLFATTGSTPRHTVLRNAVRVMRFDAPDPYSIMLLAAVIKNAPKLYELELSLFFSIPTLSSEDLHLLKMHRPGISALRFTNCLQPSTVLHQLLRIWPTVRFLTLSGPKTVDEPWKDAKRVRLYELCYAPDKGGFNLPFLHWILSSSRSTLQILELSNHLLPGFAEIMQEHGATLRSLRLQRWIPEHIVQVTLHCVRLEELHIWEPLQLKRTDATVFYSLPQTLQHVSFWDVGPYFVDLFGMFVTQHRNVRVATFAYHPPDHPREISAMKAICSNNKIRMRLKQFFLEDLVETTFFPRNRSFANFALMQDR